jgi:hypothetical protein
MITLASGYLLSLPSLAQGEDMPFHEKRPAAASPQSIVTLPAPSRTGRSREALANPLCGASALFLQMQQAWTARCLIGTSRVWFGLPVWAFLLSQDRA